MFHVLPAAAASFVSLHVEFKGNFSFLRMNPSTYGQPGKHSVSVAGQAAHRWMFAVPFGATIEEALRILDEQLTQLPSSDFTLKWVA